MVYIGYPLETNPGTLLQKIYSYIQARVPGWTPAEGNLATWLSEAYTAEVAEGLDVASIVPDNLFMYLGRSLYAVPQQVATAASTTTTWTMIDNAGHTIPAGTQVGIRDAGGNLIPFYTVNEVTVLPGATVTAAGAVSIAALTPGLAASGIGGIGANVELTDILDFVASVSMVAATINGLDAESDADYMNRLVKRFRLLTITPVQPQEFADLAKTVDTVYRAVAIDLYNPYHNYLSLNEASIEADATGWANLANATLAQSATQAADGTKSLRLTAASSADMSASLAASRVVVPGETYTAVAFFRAGTTGRNVKVGLQWRTAGDVLVSTDFGANVAVTNAAFSEAYVTAKAPPTGAKVRVVVYVIAPVNTEIHYVDKMGLRHGFTTDWVHGDVAETGNEKSVTVASIDSSGAAVSGPVRTDVEDFLESLREVNFVVNTIDPQVNSIDTTVQVKVLPGFDQPTVQSAVEDAIDSFYDPSTWGIISAGADGSNDATSWQNRNTIYRYELASAINAVDGVDYINGALTLAIHGEALLEQDLAMRGLVPLPSPGTITVTTI